MSVVVQDILNMEAQQRCRKEKNVATDVSSMIRRIPTYPLASYETKSIPAELLKNDEEDGFESHHSTLFTDCIAVDAEGSPIRIDDIKPRLTRQHHDILESHFQTNRKPSTRFKRNLAADLGVPLDKVNNWFQNRRARTRQDLKIRINQDVDHINSIMSRHAPHIPPIESPKISYTPTPDWSFLQREHDFAQPTSIGADCPSLSSGSTISSRNSSTRSSKSLRWQADDLQELNQVKRGSQSPYLQTQQFQPYPCFQLDQRLRLDTPSQSSYELDNEAREKRLCPLPECGRVFKDLKDHMLTHQNERPEKCPIATCQYHREGFARKYDKNRHILTHYKGTMVCGFCPGSGSAAEKSFNRADVFKRHLTAVHGVEQNPPNSRRRKKSPTGKEIQSLAGKCSTCSVIFANAQEFYEHLDGCVLRIVQQADPSEVNIQRLLTSVTEDRDIVNTLDRNHLPNNIEHTIPYFDKEEGEDEMLGSQKMTKSMGQNLHHRSLVEAQKPHDGELAAISLSLESSTTQEFPNYSPDCVDRKATDTVKNEAPLILKPGADDNHGSPRNDSVITGSGSNGLNEPISPETKHRTDLRESYRCIFCGNVFDSVEALKSHDEIHNRHGGDTPSTENIIKLSHTSTTTQDEETNTIKLETKPKPTDDSESADADVEELTASSRCLSLTSNEFRSSDEETDWTEDVSSPQSQPDAISTLSPLKRQLVDVAMKEFHRLFDRGLSKQHNNKGPQIQTYHGGSTSSHGCSGASTSSGNSSTGSPYVSRKRSLSGGGSPPPNGDKNNGDDPNKRRRPDFTPQGKDSYLPERRFACPYYKRNPGRHQTFTSCRDPGFITVARLKEHLYRRHLLPIQCNRCCSTFANEPSLREHQRDPHGCEVQEQVPLEGFDKDQERMLKSKKRSQAYQSEEDKWKSVYRILFPDDNEDTMPSPYIEYQTPGNPPSDSSSTVARFQEFSRFELPRLVRRTLEVVVEEEAQPLEDRLKDRLVDIVKECQTQLISMFQGSEGTLDVSNIPSLAPEPAPQLADAVFDASFQGFESFSTAPEAELCPQYMKGTEQCAPMDTQNIKTPTGADVSDSPDSGYDSTWTTATFPPDAIFSETSFLGGENEYVDLGGYYGLFENRGTADGFETSMWSFANSTAQASANRYPDASISSLPGQ